MHTASLPQRLSGSLGVLATAGFELLGFQVAPPSRTVGLPMSKPILKKKKKTQVIFMHIHTSVVRFPQAFRSQLTHLRAAFQGFSSVSAAWLPPLKVHRKFKHTNQSPKHLAREGVREHPAAFGVRALRPGCSASKTPTRRRERRHRRARLI